MNGSLANAKLTLINELANGFARRLELDELIPFVLSRCREIFGASGISLLILDPERNELYFPYVSEGDAEAGKRLSDVRFPATQGIAGAVLSTGRSEVIPDVRTDPRFYSEADRKTGTATGSLLAAPLNSGEIRLGVIEAVRRTGDRPFTAEDLELFDTLAGSIAIALDNAGRFGEVKASAEQLRAEVGALRRQLARSDRFSEIIAVSPAMTEVFTLMEAAAASTMTVLIEGETGTGKELVARAIHRTSDRASRPFIALNCAAVPEGLLESELFGHRRGAFTGALDDQQGLFRAASGGVLFLDEIGEMPIQMQAKLLRVLQEGEVTPVGDSRTHKVDVRVISATNRDLDAAITARTFRKDLYYRLAVLVIPLPPLSNRSEDIPLLAARFLEAAARRHRKRLPGFKPEVIDLLTTAEWPGNVRQLQNEIERAAALARDGESIALRHLSHEIANRSGLAHSAPVPAINSFSDSRNRESAAGSKSPSAPRMRSLGEARAEYEKRYIEDALSRCNNNISRTAIALGVSRVTLQKKMKEYLLR